jgi:hypothetical protein
MLPDHWPPLHRLLREIHTLRRVRRTYRQTHGHYPSLFPPRTYNEKIQYHKLYDRRPYLTLTSDKLAVRDYAREKLGLDLAPALLHVTADPATLPFPTLPRRFVVKATHGSGWVQLVPDKTTLDHPTLIAQCREWLRQDFSPLYQERFYRDIPRRILVEEFLDGGNGHPPPDIKLLVFNQRVKIIQVDTGRFTPLHRRNFFDRHWNELGIGGDEARGTEPVPRPSRLDDMIRYAEILAQETDFVRIDLYQIGDRIVFGEMTHTPASGLDRLTPPGTDAAWGKLWQMDYARIHQRRSS